MISCGQLGLNAWRSEQIWGNDLPTPSPSASRTADNRHAIRTSAHLQTIPNDTAPNAAKHFPSEALSLGGWKTVFTGFSSRKTLVCVTPFRTQTGRSTGNLAPETRVFNPGAECFPRLLPRLQVITPLCHTPLPLL